jgi:hypothetical protein
MCLCLPQVASGIAAQAEQWKQDYGEVLAHASKAKLDKVMDKILGWQVQRLRGLQDKDRACRAGRV